MRSTILKFVIHYVVVVLTSAMGSTQDMPAIKKSKPIVVTTVAPITNIVYNIGGDRISLHGVIPEGVDSHTFEPAPSDVKYIAEADLIILNGLHLEIPTEKLAMEDKKGGVQIYKLGDNTVAERDWIFDFSFPKEKGDPNPHLWLNVAYAMRYAELVRDKLIEIDPGNREYYIANTRAYLKRLDLLDKAIFKAVATIPEKNRKLLTYHDSWSYFAKRYGMTVIGAIQPSDFSEPSPREVAALIDQLKKDQVPAIFGSEVYPSKVEEQIAREAGVRHITTLRDDDLPGSPGAREHTYIGMMLENIKNMVSALGGDVSALSGIDPSNVPK